MKTAKTSQDSSTINRLAALYAVALTLVQSGVRTKEMIEVLLRALQLFKENRLGKVIPIDHEAEMRWLRIAFREHFEQKISPQGSKIVIADLGLSEATNATCFLRLSFEATSLLNLVQMRRADVERQIGHRATEEIVARLATRGLYFGMEPDHMVEAFGLRP